MNQQPGLIKISGEQTKKLLQGQLTCNMDEVIPLEPLLAAHCNPQGRVISLFWLFQWQEDFYLLTPQSLVHIAINALKKYAVFFKVTLTDVSDQAQHLLSQLTVTPKLPDIAAGIPAIHPETSEKFLPHELNLHNLKAVSFNKGCYTGQEIIARMQYRGKLKNHLYTAKASIPNLQLSRGAEIFDSHGPCGYLVDFEQVGYNNYELLVIAPHASVGTIPLFLDTDKKIELGFKL